MITRTTAAAAALAVAASLLLGGCSLLPPLPFLGGDSGSSSDDRSSDSSGDDGDRDSESGIEDNPFVDHEVPDTFPSDVPVPDLDIVFALDVGTGWSITFSSDDIHDDHEKIKDLFDGGWEILSDSSTDDLTFTIFDNADYQVQVTGSTESSDFEGPIITYLVVAKD